MERHRFFEYACRETGGSSATQASLIVGVPSRFVRRTRRGAGAERRRPSRDRHQGPSGHRRNPEEARSRGLAHVQPHVRRAAFQSARADRPRQRRHAATRLDERAAERAGRGDSARLSRRDVPAHAGRARRRQPHLGARCRDRQPALGVQAGQQRRVADQGARDLRRHDLLHRAGAGGQRAEPGDRARRVHGPGALERARSRRKTTRPARSSSKAK